MIFAIALVLALQVTSPGEEPVDPYPQSNTNAGATPFANEGMWEAFHRAEGVGRIVDDLVVRSQQDRRIAEIFKGQDLVRLRRTLREQFCYILGGGCDYSGRDMKSAHKDMGLQTADLGALIENLQKAMQTEGVPFRAQNRFLAKLAPMKRNVLQQ